MSPSANQLAIARRAPTPSRGGAPYAKPALVRPALQHRCRECGDYILPSQLREFRAQAFDKLAVPDVCWNCAEQGA